MTNPTPRPLEVLAAEKVLGWPLLTFAEAEDRYDLRCWIERKSGGGYLLCTSGGDVEPLDINSWSGLGLVVEAMEAMGWTVLIERNENGWDVEFERYGAALKGDHHRPRPWTAAQLAALRALGVPEEEIQRAVEVGDG